MTTEAPPTTKSSCKRLRLSVRALMVLVMLLGGGLGWITYRARVQREAVSTIRRAGASIWFNRHWPVDWHAPELEPGPPLLRRWLGPEYFDSPSGVHYIEARSEPKPDGDAVLKAACKLNDLEDLAIVYTDATDAGTEEIGNLHKLKSLDLRLNQMTPAAVKDFGKLTDLRELKIASIPLRDQDLVFLRSLTKLETLSLMGKTFRATDACLDHIENLTALKSLSIYDIPITSQGLRRIERLTNLEFLSLWDAKFDRLESLQSLKKLKHLCLFGSLIDDDDLPTLKTFSKLSNLNLSNTKITDRGLVHLAALPMLIDLSLDGTAITDDALIELAKLPKLRSISIRRTKISPEAVTKFKTAQPKVSILQ